MNSPSVDGAVNTITETFHIKTIANYLPIIILFVILLIGFISWDLMTSNWPIVVTFIVTFLYVAYVHYLQPNKFLDMKKIADDLSSPTILPLPPNEKFEWFMSSVGFEKIFRIIIPIALSIIGIGLGFGSISVIDIAESYNPSVGLMTIGGILLCVAVIIFVVLTIKYVRSSDTINEFQPSKYIPLVILFIVIGIPLVVKGNQINQDLSNNINDQNFNSTDYRKSIANTSADWMLGIGIFFQIAVFIAIGYYIWRNTNYTNGKFNDLKSKLIFFFIVIIGLIFSPGIMFIAASQKWPGFKKIAGNVINTSDYGLKSFLVHGIIWLIAAIVFCIILIGQTSQYTIHRFMLPGSCFLLCIWILVSWGIFAEQNLKQPTAADILDKDNNNNDFSKSPYYQQVRREVEKDLKQKNPNATQDNVETAIKERLEQKENKKSQEPTHAILGTFSFLSIIIAIFILVFYNVRLQMAECAVIPGFSFNDLFLYVVNGQCASPPVPNPSITAEQAKIKEDTMISNDWDKVISTEGTNSSTTIRLSKWFSLIPFLSIIMLVMWISVLFTNVTTSHKTSDWIANKFSADMFPRVKELIDTFFIVLIVGFLLCAILFLPFVKELNAGGLETILKFVESIQVWQYDKRDPSFVRIILSVVGFLLIFGGGLSWWWHYLINTRKGDSSLPIVPDNWGWGIAIVVIFAFCTMPSFYNFGSVNNDFKKEFVLKHVLRQVLTTIYLVPLLFAVLFRACVYGLASFTGIQDFIDKRNNALNTLKFWEWDANGTDLRLFPTDNENPKPSNVTSILFQPPQPPQQGIAQPIAPIASINHAKVSAVGKLIKVILLIISFVIIILSMVFYVYKVDAEFIKKGAEADTTETGGFISQMNSPTAHTIYVIIAIVGIAGIVAYLRDSFTKANSKTPENYLFDDLKTEDSSNPLRQLAFGATHIVYVILMVIVWIYDRNKDDNNLMSVTGMTILGIAILLFHYGLEFIDTLNRKPTAEGAENRSSISDIFTNIRFIINTIFLIVLSALAYYKQHGVMVVLILAMFIFHLTKSIIGLKLLKMLWLCIIYIPCLFLDLLQSSQGAVGDTTRPIWIIVAIELILIAVLFGGPYLLNYIGASASQVIASPVPLKQKYDTNLNTQSPQIFIYHNTGIDRTPEDKAANCPVEEKKRYNYSISGWFLLNNNTSSSKKDLEIFNFGDVPFLTYNNSTTELKLWCKTLDMSGNPYPETELIYNSKNNYNTIISGKTKDKQDQIRILFDNDDVMDVSVPLQKWNYFVINYNGKTMDFFLNTKLVSKSDFIMPDIVMKPITIGDTTDNKGLNGSICNFAFHNVPLTKEQMRWTYNMLKSQNPPLIGTTTIEDEVNKAGTTEIYSK